MLQSHSSKCTDCYQVMNLDGAELDGRISTKATLGGRVGGLWEAACVAFPMCRDEA
jgi:hypothetical protein